MNSGAKGWGQYSHVYEVVVIWRVVIPAKEIDPIIWMDDMMPPRKSRLGDPSQPAAFRHIAVKHGGEKI